MVLLRAEERMLEELLALMRFRLLLILALLVGVFLVELGTADGARVVLFEPGLDAAAVEGVVARQCAAGLAVGALFKADVAVCVLTFLLLGQVLDEVSCATAALGLTGAVIVEEGLKGASLTENLMASEEAIVILLTSGCRASEELAHELVSALGCSYPS